MDDRPMTENSAGGEAAAAGGLLDLLGVCAVVLDQAGRIVLWSPQAEEVFGYTAEEALGHYAAHLLVDEHHHDMAVGLFAQVMATGASWAGAFPVRRKDGVGKLVEFRNTRLVDDQGDAYALGIAAGQDVLHQLETGLALSGQLVSQSPIGLALLDPDLRYLLVNPALERINGLPAADHIGRRPRDVLTFLDTRAIESDLQDVLAVGIPVVDRYVVGRTPAAPDDDHAWSVSYYRLDGAGGQCLGVAISVVDVTERHRATAEAERGRRRLNLLAKAAAVGTTLEVETTAQELANAVVPDLADLAAVDILDSALALRRGTEGERSGPFRAMGLATAYPNEAVSAADRVGDIASYRVDRLITRCVRTGRPVLVPEVTDADLQHIARDADAARQLARTGLHSYLAVPLIVRNEVLGAVDMMRARTPEPFDDADVVLAAELASRAAIAIDNARWHQGIRNTAETLQRSLLPGPPPLVRGLDVASHYQPAQASSAVGGDWFDIIALEGDRTALVVGDVMGHGIDAAAAMGRLRTATQAYADLGMPPDEVLSHLDAAAVRLESQIATCVYAVYDPHRRTCQFANAGHMPAVLVPKADAPRLLALPAGTPLGIGGASYRTTEIDLHSGDRIVLYTDGLIETRHEGIDERLDLLLQLLARHSRPTETTFTYLLDALHDGDSVDDIALLIAQAW
ncbi:SpoIIE family protein phosphatase [Streptomyces longispororuber]|uniref:SpoIIE family protein phosphatase n=1 Tax=Streptomyces longispororuber TaxID=68230 RepID=UPI00210E06C2|nr:SpoIIE family protein phosphatase [Streptomyces longispororuber]MCQ4211506.1 SpoIIE family protein phosphatase [Streptomyces longispororuber]